MWLKVRSFPGSPYVFCSMADGRALNWYSLTWILRRLKRRAGVSGRVNPHAFRHAFAREYILNGGDLATVSEILGHSQIPGDKAVLRGLRDEELRAKHEQFSPVGRLPLSDGKGKGRQSTTRHLVSLGERESPPRGGF